MTERGRKGRRAVKKVKHRILMQNRQKEKVKLGLIRDLAREVLKDLGCGDAELSVVLTDDNAIQGLNKRYLNKDRPTDVLSFPMFPHPASRIPHPVILGDVVISVETAKMQAEHRGVKADEEFARLLIHGILHLLGFDHEKGGRQAQKMRKEEDRLLDRVKTK